MTISIGLRFLHPHTDSRTLYTDGSYDNGVAGWAVVEGNRCLHQDWGVGIHSNLAEGMGILSALQILGGSGPGVIYTDSLSWVHALNLRGKVKGEKSKMVLEEAMDRMSPQIQVLWIPGHSKIPGNELVDSYAKEARSAKVSKSHKYV